MQPLSDLEVWIFLEEEATEGKREPASGWDLKELQAWYPRRTSDKSFLCVLSGPSTRPVQASLSSVLAYIEMLTFHNPQVTQACQERPQANTEKIIKGHWWRLFLCLTSHRWGRGAGGSSVPVRFWGLVHSHTPLAILFAGWWLS